MDGKLWVPSAHKVRRTKSLSIAFSINWPLLNRFSLQLGLNQVIKRKWREGKPIVCQSGAETLTHTRIHTDTHTPAATQRHFSSHAPNFSHISSLFEKDFAPFSFHDNNKREFCFITFSATANTNARRNDKTAREKGKYGRTIYSKNETLR